MIDIEPAHFGRHATRVVKPGDVLRVELRLPATTAAILYELAHASERTLSSIVGEAIRDFDARCRGDPAAPELFQDPEDAAKEVPENPDSP